jgi:hypothetical protein
MLVTAQGLGSAQLAAAAGALCDARPSQVLFPAAWVHVTIRPAGPVTADLKGQFLHCRFVFAQPPESRSKRREYQKDFQPTPVNPGQEQGRPAIQVDCDPGVYWIGTSATLFLVGGTQGDVYEVTVTQSVTRAETRESHEIDLYEPPFEFWLTTHAAGAGPIAPPEHHSLIRVVQGQISSGGLNVGNGIGLASFTLPVPTNTILATTGPTIFQTGGSL